MDNLGLDWAKSHNLQCHSDQNFEQDSHVNQLTWSVANFCFNNARDKTNVTAPIHVKVCVNDFLFFRSRAFFFTFTDRIASSLTLILFFPKERSTNLYIPSLSKEPVEFLMDRPNDPIYDEPGPFLELIGQGGLVGNSDVYEVSVDGIKKAENPECAAEGGVEDGYNNLWKQEDKWCGNFLLTAWRNCMCPFSSGDDRWLERIS